MRFTRGRVRELKNAHNSVTVQNRTHVYMNIFDHRDLGNHLLQYCPQVVKHPVYRPTSISSLRGAVHYVTVGRIRHCIPSPTNKCRSSRTSATPQHEHTR